MSDSAPIVFVVDDDESVRTALARLMRSAGLAVRSFASGEEFLVVLRPGMTGCLIVDMHMPGMNGLELQSHMSELGSTMPIIFITAYENLDAESRAIRAGALAFLRKPFDDEVLLQLISQALGGGRREGPTDRLRKARLRSRGRP